MDVAVPTNMHQGPPRLGVIGARGEDLVGQPDVVLIDLRETAERERHGSIRGSLHAPYRELQENIGADGLLHELAEATGKCLLFYCAFGERSAMAVLAAQDAGLTTARHIQGGIDAWKRIGGTFD